MKFNKISGARVQGHPHGIRDLATFFAFSIKHLVLMDKHILKFIKPDSGNSRSFWLRGIITPLVMAVMLAGCATPHPGDFHHVDPMSSLIRFYRGPLNHLAAVRTGSCPMHPGCSEFALSAIEKHGPMMGWIMACDRLMRCGGDETRLSPEVWVNGSFKYLDTIEQNDFWWTLSTERPPLIYSTPPERSREWGISIE